MSQITTIPDETISNKIYFIRNQKVMLDSDLAELYQVETRRLNEQVKRNASRFPEDFMFRLTDKEWENLKSQNATSSWGGRRKAPYVFTEHGVLMLSSVLNSPRAIAVNIQVMRVFIKIRAMIQTNQELLSKLETLERKGVERDKKIVLIFDYLKGLEKAKKQRVDQQNRTRIGFKIGKNKE